MNLKLLSAFWCLSWCCVTTTTTTTALNTQPPARPPAHHTSTGTSRRTWLSNVAAATVAATIFLPPSPAAAGITATSARTSTTTTTTFQAYQVIPDASAALSPTLKTVQNKQLLSKLSRIQSGAIWLGEHHNSPKDHALQNEIIQQLASSRSRTSTTTTSDGKSHNMAIGLEQVQMQFQHVLDDYLADKLTLAQLKDGVEWEQLWQWPFENYAPIFETAKELQIPLLALNVNSQDLELVGIGGLPNLTPALLKQYIPDRRGFASFAAGPSFATYVDYVIRPSYELHAALGLLNYNFRGEKLKEPVSFRNFFSSRILWDECMATRAYEWTKNNGGDTAASKRLLVGLVGADHVKLEKGIPGRYARMVASSAGTIRKGGDINSSISVILNPTVSDTRPAASVNAMMANNNLSSNVDQLALQLRYLRSDLQEGDDRSLPSSTGGVLSMSDYLLVS